MTTNDSSPRIATRFFEILEPAVPGDRVSRVFDLFMIWFIVVNVLAALLRSVSLLEQRFGAAYDTFELITVLVFALEYVARLWTCTRYADVRRRGPVMGRLRYIVSPKAIVDLLSFAPFFVTLFVPLDPHVVHVLPLLRVLKLARYSPALETLGRVVHTERRTLGAAAIIMLVLLLFSSSLIYLVEREAQPTVFASIPDAMWWGIATLTTVGYGDVTPITPLGKFFGAIVTVLGIAMFALPAGILATGFAQEIRHREFLVTWNLVASVPLFADLNATEIARIARLLVPMVVQQGQVVVRRGDEADCMFFVVSGDLEVELEDRRFKLEDEFFGEIAILKRQTRAATVSALTTTQLLVLHVKHLEDFLDSHPQIAETIHRIAQEHFSEALSSR